MRTAAVSLLLATLAAGGAFAAEADLLVTARYPIESTGTMHYAEALTFAIGSAEPLHREEDCCLPIPGPHFRVSAQAFILLGWSSTGGGMQSLHVLSLAVREGAVVLIQEMVLTTGRMDSGLLARPGGGSGFLIGIPRPPAGYAHNEDEWSLDLGDEKTGPFNLEQIRSLPFQPAFRREGDVYYNPPFARGSFPAQLAWLKLGSSGRFEPPPARPLR